MPASLLGVLCFCFSQGSCEFCCSCSFSPLVLRKVVYCFSHLYCRTVRWLGGGGGSHESFLLTLDSLTVACSSELGVSAKELRHLGVGMRWNVWRERKLKARLLIPAARTLPQNIVHRPSGLPKEKLVESHCPETSLPGSRCIWPCASSALNFCPYFQFPCGSSCDQLGKVSSMEGIETLLPVVHTHSSEPRPVCSWLLKVKTA